jgi:hypothetical protein
MQEQGLSEAESDYARLLTLLDDCAAREIDAALHDMDVLTEPHVARELSRLLPPGARAARASLDLCAAVIHAPCTSPISCSARNTRTLVFGAA